MIDASKGFMKDGPKNRLRAQDIHRIVDTFTRQAEIPRYSRIVSVAEISDPKNDFNLNLPRYVDSSEPEDLQDIDGHLRGGIPDRDIDALAPYWQVIPSVRAALFKQADRPGYCEMKLAIAEVKPAILGHEEFKSFKGNCEPAFCRVADGQHAAPQRLRSRWSPESSWRNTLQKICSPPSPRHLLLTSTTSTSTSWTTGPKTMQDDCYIISTDGWKAGNQIREILQVKNKDGKLVWPEGHDYKKGKRRFKSDLIPANVLIARYFVAERQAIQETEGELATIEQQLDQNRKRNKAVKKGCLRKSSKVTATNKRLRPSRWKPASRKSVKTPSSPMNGRPWKITTRYSKSRQTQRVVRKVTQGTWTPSWTRSIPNSPRTRSRKLVVDNKWLSDTRWLPVQGELDRVSREAPPVESANWLNGMPNPPPPSLTAEGKLTTLVTSTSQKRWERMKARIQADRGGCLSRKIGKNAKKLLLNWRAESLIIGGGHQRSWECLGVVETSPRRPAGNVRDGFH